MGSIYSFPYGNCSFLCQSGYSLQRPQQLCVGCPYGQYGATAGAVDGCTPCPAGWWTSDHPATSNTACVPPSSIANWAGWLSDPVLFFYCAGGFQATRGATSTCQPCAAVANSISLEPDPTNQCRSPSFTCMPGYVPDTVTYACVTQCAAGYYAYDAACYACQAGTYGVAGSTRCLYCDVGTYASQTGATGCANCTSGAYTDRIGMDLCASCARGTYGTGVGASSCTACAAGSYGSGSGMSSASACVVCVLGTYSAAPAASACAVCGAGTYSTSSGASAACSKCWAGSYAGTANATACVVCGVGTYSAAQVPSRFPYLCAPLSCPFSEGPLAYP